MRAEFREHRLESVRSLSPSSRLYTVALLPDEAADGGAFHSVQVRSPRDGASRPYSPVGAPGDRTLTLLVKRYAGGAVSSHLHALVAGDVVLMRAPRPRVCRFRPDAHRAVGMLAGGTGVAPMLQLIRAFAADPLPGARLVLLYSSSTEEEVLLREELDEWAGSNEWLSVVYVVTRPARPAEETPWVSYRRRVDKQMIAETLPAPAPGTAVYYCGPGEFNGAVAGAKTAGGRSGGMLQELGYAADSVFKV